MPLTSTDVRNNPIWSAAKRDNELVYALNQYGDATTVGPAARSIPAQGVCVALSVHWLERRRAGRDLPYDRQTSICPIAGRPGIGRIGVLHNAYHGAVPFADTLHGMEVEENDKEVLRRAGLTILSSGPKSTFTVRNFVYYLSSFRLRSGFCYIGLSHGDLAHAIAAQIPANGAPRFFDPLYGQFKFASVPALELWMGGFLKNSVYGRAIAPYEMKFHYVS